MGLDDLIARLERDADARVAAIRARAQAEAEAIASAAGSASAKHRDETLAARRAERGARLGRELAAARQRAKSELLSRRHETLERIFARASELLAEAERDERYLAAVPQHLEEALRHVEGVPAEVRCRPSVARRLEPVLAGRAQLELVEDPGAPLGVVVRAKDGTVEVDNTLGARLQNVRQELGAELMRRVES